MTDSPAPDPPAPPCVVPREPLPRLFARFLRFGAFAWGGPVAQIAMIRRELVDEARWIDPAEFNRALAVYQILPGPEAHELCVYFGMRARGRAGAIVAGLGFMLPGFGLMFAAAWAYVRFGLDAPGVRAAFAAVQIAVAALIVRAIVRIGRHALTDPGLWSVAVLAAVAHLAGLPFGVVLPAAGAVHVLARRHLPAAAIVVAVLGIAAIVAMPYLVPTTVPRGPVPDTAMETATALALFWSGLKAGLLTFGGAYTAIPFVRHDAVQRGGWLTDAQFLDGLAIGSVLPAPLIIFATFVGYVAGGPAGALAMTAGVFLPAFLFTLAGHDVLERVVHAPRIRAFLDGVTAGVVGLIAATTIGLLRTGVNGIEAAVVFAVALAILFAFSSRWTIPAVIAGAAAWGVLGLATTG